MPRSNGPSRRVFPRRQEAQAADGLWLYYAALTETDLNDIMAYLRTVPPLQ
jgi:hypothetical protein